MGDAGTASSLIASRAQFQYLGQLSMGRKDNNRLSSRVEIDSRHDSGKVAALLECVLVQV